MWNKKGRLATVLFVGVMLLPLVGLLIMDYQVKRANDLTGRYLLEGGQAYVADNMLATVIIIAVFAVLLATVVAGKIRSSRAIKTHHLAKINEDIKQIDERLKSE